MDFPQCLADRFEEFEGEKWIEVAVAKERDVREDVFLLNRYRIHLTR